MAPSLTILAPTHNRPDVLDKVWPSWLLQAGLKEIVIVNDGSTESYENVFAALMAACNIQNVRLKIVEITSRIGSPAAKNVGLSRCSCDEILTTDDDIELPDDMVARCREERPAIDAPVLIGPRVIYLKDGESKEAALIRCAKEQQPYFDMAKLLLCPWSHPGEVTSYPFITAIVLWPAYLFRRGLRFHERYGGNGYREESDPQLNAAMTFGAKVYLAPDAHCFHLPPCIAYAGKGGQRRGGLLWFEYWTLCNNFFFLKRFASYLKLRYGISPTRAWLNLALSRISPSRILRVLRS